MAIDRASIRRLNFVTPKDFLHHAIFRQGRIMQSSDHTNRSNTPRRRGRVACNKCRELKIRCGVEKAPCPRCERSGLTCVVDPEYRRIGKQGKMDELQSHIQQLESLVRNQTSTGAAAVSASPSCVRAGAEKSIESDHDYGTTVQGSGSVGFTSQNHAQPGPLSDLTIEPLLNHGIGPDRSLGHVVLKYAQIQSLFAM